MTTDTPEPAFWMVYGTGCGAPARRHHLRSEAIAEAERLARANPGTKFYVLQAIKSRLAPLSPLEAADLGGQDEVPF